MSNEDDNAQAPRPEKVLSPQAQRALEEAKARRKALDAAEKARPKEINGRKGPNPSRYGDWEKKGIASDF